MVQLKILSHLLLPQSISTCDTMKSARSYIPEYQRYYAPISQPDILPVSHKHSPDYRADILPESPADILPGYFVDRHITGGEGPGETIVLWA